MTGRTKAPKSDLRDIELRGVTVHNLQNIDIDFQHNQLIAFCGVSGSGKTSLALDTLYAEGQRRYIESFSAYTRQFLDRLEKPVATSLTGIPPAVAVTRKTTNRNSRSTIGTATETADYLRLLFAKIGTIICPQCVRTVQQDSAESVAKELTLTCPNVRCLVGFTATINHQDLLRESEVTDSGLSDMIEQSLSGFLENGFVRVIAGNATFKLDDQMQQVVQYCCEQFSQSIATVQLIFVVDRLSVPAAEGSPTRFQDSLETAFAQPTEMCVVLVEQDTKGTSHSSADGKVENTRLLDRRSWCEQRYSASYQCKSCEREFSAPQPRLYSFNSPLGACPTCEGFGNVIHNDMELIVPDERKTIREGAIAPWNSPAYEHERHELLALAEDYDLPVDVPFSELKKSHLKIIHEGIAEREFGGLNGFFAWLEKRKYKMHLRVFLSRWRSYRRCAQCNGNRLNAEALATSVGGSNIAEICQMKIRDVIAFFGALKLSEWQFDVGKLILEQVRGRLYYLDKVGLGYLTLDRTLRTLSGGESQRVSLTTALGSSLVNMLYVLDEPSVGLHPRDVEQLSTVILDLRNRGNTVVVVEHEPSMIQLADQVVEFGPGAGKRGGRITFQGTPTQMLKDEKCLTGAYLSGARGELASSERRETNHGWIKLRGATGHNLQNVTAEFPLGVLCLVTGVSGSGKSTLVQDTLYGALCKRKRQNASKPLPYKDVVGDGQIDEVVLIDQSPIGRSPRSNPVTYIKAFDQIRTVFAETLDARTHNYTPGHFSFNVDGGRCTTCNGDGHLEIDMQFLADVFMRCPQCGGSRYGDDVLQVTYRGMNIAGVLDMTVREAFSFFRGQPKVQTKLKRLIDVGLEYLSLGQPANTLSSGEAQRLKLASYMSTKKRQRTLFILDEPTTGLHFSDVLVLQDCFDTLLAVGHSMVVVEHNLQLMKAADYIIDLGPGAADEGGVIVASGTPEQVADNPDSYTGQYLKAALKQRTELSG
jgi:excinuclease ABC subunit A